MYAPVFVLDSLVHLVLFSFMNDPDHHASSVATKLHAIVGGQTSCKDPEIKAFEKHLPPDVDIVSCHSLHGPRVDSKDQPLVRPAQPFVLDYKSPG